MREVITKEEFQSLKISGIQSLGHYKNREASRHLAPHAHENAMEFVYIAQGKQAYTVNGVEYDLSGGDVFLTYPNETHSTGTKPEEVGEIYWLIIEINPQENLLGLDRHHSVNLQQCLLNIPKRQYKCNKLLKILFDSVFESMREKAKTEGALLVQSKLLEALNHFIQVANQATESTLPFQDLTQYIHDNLEDKITISDLAQIANLSSSRLKVSFKSQIGLSPGEYITRQRIEKAKKLIKETNLSFTEIAFECGFPSSQYFSSVFKKYVIKTPREYKASHK